MDITKNKFYALFERQQKNQFAVANTSFKTRIQKLNKLKKAVEETYREQILQAIYDDFKKPATETDLTEVYQIVGEIKFVRSRLRSWMGKQRVETPLTLTGSSSWVRYEPKGVCLIISPWNFPFNLTLGPLISAVAAGNTVIIKPSEMTPNSSRVMKQIIEAVFPENEVALLEGEVEVAQELLKLPFNHIFFTGSPKVGKLVMQAAAQNLSSVTLELGGKSPTIVDQSANLKTAARKIAWAKFMNAGQVCISPDYLLVQESVKEVFLSELQKQIRAMFTESPSQSDSYARIVNSRHLKRLMASLEEARGKGGEVVTPEQIETEDNYFPPTLVLNPPQDSTLMQEEIFGPILPVISYGKTEEAIAFINQKEKPLALYIYSKNRKTAKKIIQNTRAGATCINNSVVHYANHNLPFGGSNNSGIGKSHGFYGFKAFSNERAILKQHTPGAMELLFPPYTNLKKKLARLTIKWF
ncbi:aldehyde dehydrogenase family protein [Lentiprolixibacter aurantiacus]|uniref:Aldehyde dehydrogenase n=1 Tax=Lentiprolixibacter aurantiacus TaxID=2993939 RepID=A0AAE3SMZ7_9FLAO|nr:aldehyde dehydrogenase family protein [Lentiprolixibacter aurantiacus]MCX2719202.1 aldehyde dehydrogenase family protein [Lentiprolixibacter aurantiacus]